LILPRGAAILPARATRGVIGNTTVWSCYSWLSPGGVTSLGAKIDLVPELSRGSAVPRVVARDPLAVLLQHFRDVREPHVGGREREQLGPQPRQRRLGGRGEDPVQGLARVVREVVSSSLRTIGCLGACA